MRAVSFVFLACSLLFLSNFVTSTSPHEEVNSPYEDLVYRDVIRNAINSFIKRRNEVLNVPGNRQPRNDIVPLDKFGFHWSGTNGYFNLEVYNHELAMSRLYNVTAVNIIQHRSYPVINVNLDLMIPMITIQGGTWSFRGRWHESALVVFGPYMATFTNVEVRIQMDLQLEEFGGDNFWQLNKVTIDKYELIPTMPSYDSSSVWNFPDDIPMRGILSEMRPSIASQLERTISNFFEKNFGKCSWDRLMFGRF